MFGGDDGVRSAGLMVARPNASCAVSRVRQNRLERTASIPKLQTPTSARLMSKDRVAFTYGLVEARIQLPRGRGIWPAFWMLGQNIDAVGLAALR